jgi:hypothetical protein
MKCLFLLATLAAAALGATPAIAQLGPAGVPGIFGLAESVTAPSPATPPARAAQRPAGQGECSTSKQPEQCRARQEARKKALAACQGKTGATRNQCLIDQAQSARDHQQSLECKKASDPARCLQFQKAHRLCSAKIGPEHRQCLRDILTPQS